MTTIKIRLRASSIPGKAGSLYFSLVNKGKSAQLTTKYKLYAEEWDEYRQQVIIANSARNKELTIIDQKIRACTQTLKNIILIQEQSTGGYYSVKDIIRIYKTRMHCSFFPFLDDQINRLLDAKRFGTARNYLCTKQSFYNFLQKKELFLQDLTEEVIHNYDHWLKMKGVARNTISFYMRTLRAVYNKASEKYYLSSTPIFKNVYTGIDKTRKRAMDENILIDLLQLDLSQNAGLNYARDLFLFSFYTRGMAYVDIAYLKKTDIKYGVITYARRKTKKKMTIRLEKCMEEIIERYSNDRNDLGYLFPIITSDQEEVAYEQYKNGLCTYNKQLKKLSVFLGLSPSFLSSYVARHSWATIARNKNVPLSIISEGMGHGSESTTQIYLASLDTSVIDDANHRLILSLLAK